MKKTDVWICPRCNGSLRYDPQYQEVFCTNNECLYLTKLEDYYNRFDNLEPSKIVQKCVSDNELIRNELKALTDTVSHLTFCNKTRYIEIRDLCIEINELNDKYIELEKFVNEVKARQKALDHLEINDVDI